MSHPETMITSVSENNQKFFQVKLHRNSAMIPIPHANLASLWQRNGTRGTTENGSIIKIQQEAQREVVKYNVPELHRQHEVWMC